MKHVIVSGCARGIGAAVAERFLREGWYVTGMSRTAPEKVLARFDTDRFHYVQGDICSGEDRARLLREAAEGFGPVCSLVNVAGVAPKVRADLLEMTEESYDYVMDINTRGTFFLTQAVANHMIRNLPEGESRGTICNISSLSAYTSSVNRGEYCISKAGVSMITNCLPTGWRAAVSPSMRCGLGSSRQT